MSRCQPTAGKTTHCTAPTKSPCAESTTSEQTDSRVPLPKGVPMKALRTPDERFDGLPGWDFGPHGEPSWAYLYRKMIPIIADAGHRVIVPDLIGFGRSDKPSEKSDYTFQRHVDLLTSFVDQLDLRDVTMFGQDWGSLIGLRVAAENPDRFARIVIGNGGLPTGDQGANEAFLRLQKFSQTSPAFDVGRLIQSATVTTLPEGVVAAYDAPFPDHSHQAGAPLFPPLLPPHPHHPPPPT